MIADLIRDVPGRLFLLAAGLPLLAFTVLLTAGFLRRVSARPGERPGLSRLPGYVAVVCIALAAAAAVAGTVTYFQEAAAGEPADARWAERVDWVRIGPWTDDARPAVALRLGYRIDRLTALMVSMVTVIGSLIFLFSLGYMKEELHADVHDHAAHVHRRGRFGRFFLYLSLFAFSMLTLLLADNLLQVFMGWELVGVCSFFLIGFYTERKSASTAANKAFIMNRVGDAGFLIGLAAAWAAFGTFDIQELIRQAAANPNHAAWPVIGFGILAGCVGKSAQVPLHTWLPDAMEGPTPVSALIHAATMVAAGVYLVGRCHPLFTADVLDTTAAIGLVTLFVSATIACVQTDIKRVLAYSTCSQLGFMMLALGLGGWAAGLLHLITHAFFKALLFLGSGAVIFGLHHEQDLARMGGLRRKMPVTAYTMLVGVLAISGVPLLSGWYSKDQILSHVAGATLGHVERPLLFALPFLTAGLTSYYMFRLWLLAFAGEPRDRHVYDHAGEAPAVMTVPLVVLSAFAVGIAWGWPVWDADASYLGKLLRAGEPAATAVRFADAASPAHEYHLLAGGLALLAAGTGFGVAASRHRAGTLLPTGPSAVRRFLQAKWYFDPLYDALFTRPTVRVAAATAAADKRPGEVGRFDAGTLDGVLNAVADTTVAAGIGLRTVQTGRLRGYALALGLTVVVGLGILVGLTR
jgi:NADH-quinone oxidoreductase subunit L